MRKEKGKKSSLFRLMIFMIAALVLMTQAAWAENPNRGVCGDGVEWTFDSAEGTLTIKKAAAASEGNVRMYDWDVNQYGRQYIGESGRYETIDEAISENRLPGYAVYADEIKKVVIESGVEYVGAYVFYNNDIAGGIGYAIESVIFSDDVTEIGEGAFWDCAKISELALPKNIKKINSFAFVACSGIEEVIFPNSLEYIGEEAFGDMGLKKVVIPESVTYLGTYAFSGNRNLTDVEIKANIEEIQPYSFQKCGAFTRFIISESVKKIGTAAFAYCGNVEDPDAEIANITLPSGLKEIGDQAFERTTVKELNLPEGLEKIGTMAFLGCNKLEEIAIPSTVTSVGKRAFEECTGLKRVSIPEGLAIDKDGVFAGCSASLEIVVKPGGGSGGGNQGEGGSGGNDSGGNTGNTVKNVNTLNISAKTAKVKFAKLKKKSQKLAITKVVKFNDKGQGAHTYAKTKGNKKIKINKKTGKITIKKGLKKGTYKIKVKVTAAGDEKYDSADKTLTIKIKIR
ncbi:MAG: leucine-rich repeat domain-containing protein [Mogibacterium sp.]|nr:leucine-rich repeat domain-containing protein [Mogibacterium sp.]